MPRFTLYRQTLADDDFEAEGWALQIRWLGLVVELVLAREAA